MQAALDWLRRPWQGRRRALPGSSALSPPAEAPLDLARLTAAPAHWDARLSQLAYVSGRSSHIHFLWPPRLAGRSDVARAGLWHVCPARVYEVRVTPQCQPQIIVNFENCIKCESCWRGSDLVDWGRDGDQRFIYAVRSPALAALQGAGPAAGLAHARPPRQRDPWAAATAPLADRVPRSPGTLNGQDLEELATLAQLLHRLEQKLTEFDALLAQEPRTIDRARADYLEMLARYAQQLAGRIVEVLRGSVLADSPTRAVTEVHARLLELASALADRAADRVRRAAERRLSWAAADGRQLRWHYLVGLRRWLALLAPDPAAARPPGQDEPAPPWLRAEAAAAGSAPLLAAWRPRLDRAFGPLDWRQRERGVPLTSEQDALLRQLLAQVPVVDADHLVGSLHPPLRKAILAELARRDPSLAFRVAAHLWARDLARLVPAAALAEAAERWARGEEWACFAPLAGRPAAPEAEALFVPALGTRSVLILTENSLTVVPTDYPGLQIEPLPTLGLRGAALARVRLPPAAAPLGAVAVDRDRILRAWHVLSAADLVSMASGMADVFFQRAFEHARQRVQFPGLFRDEAGHDTIAKFGAIKKMLAALAARRYVISTLDHLLSPSDFSAASVARAGQVKALAAELLGTAPGSLAYDAGQVLGGGAYSEEEVLSKLYRDAAAWRFLTPANDEVWRLHGDELLRGPRADGPRLATLPDEAEWFDQLAERKFLQAELDEVRVLRSQLRELARDLRDAEKWTGSTPPGNGAESATAWVRLREGLGRGDAWLLASKAVLLRTHARLEAGLPAEREVALVRVWLGEVAAALGALTAAARGGQRPTSAPLPAAIIADLGPPPQPYRDVLAAEGVWESGDFLDRPVDLRRPRLVPELQATDPDLVRFCQQLTDLFTKQFGSPRQGLPYERYLERAHRPDAGDLDFCRRHGFFRMTIPRELGGEGQRKIEYYLMTVHAHRLADVALSLTIQVSSSLGTTPVMLARSGDLPKARRDLAAFLEDAATQAEVRQRLETLSRLLASASSLDGSLEETWRDTSQTLERRVFSRPVLRVLGHRFAQTWLRAAESLGRDDVGAVRQQLEAAQREWEAVCTRAPEYLDELARRQEAGDQFLRWVASGQISAFALTEPSAGSDTARIATRAVLRSVPVEVEADGVLRFVPVGGTEPRYLLDARRLVFCSEPGSGPALGRVLYRWSETEPPAAIHVDEDNPESDVSRRQRWYQHGPRRVYFTDIAQLRQRQGRLWYDYWELHGSKMWITNGRMMGVMCLYAQTEEGVTAFMVDRHAEGLLVGKDEAKMGQRGSPTNELTLQAVRVPRENVIGLEGRGQVNALETLNVGRAGLAMSATSPMPGLIAQARAFAEAEYGTPPPWVTARLEALEQARFIAEALAFEVVGRFEHPQTRSVRLESAIAKMLVSELLHEMIELAEEVHGLAGQTEQYLVEKRKRDARVLTIYEGTNEVQRFLILRELVSDVAARWTRQASNPMLRDGPAAQLEAAKAAFRRRVDAAINLFGPELWQNPNLQPGAFQLAEAAAWLKAADSTLGRLAWWQRQAGQPSLAAGADEARRCLAVGQAAFHRCLAEVEHRLGRWDTAWNLWRQGYDTAEIRAASLLLESDGDSVSEAPAKSVITQPLRVLVVVEPVPVLELLPGDGDMSLQQPCWTLSAADGAALELALRLRDEATAVVSIDVAAAAPAAAGSALREALSLGVDRVGLLVVEEVGVAPEQAARLLADSLRSGMPYDLVLGGSTSPHHEEGSLAILTAAALGVAPVGSARRLAVQKTETSAEVCLVGGNHHGCPWPLPAAVSLTADLPLRPFRIDGYLAGLERGFDVIPWPDGLTVRARTPHPRRQAQPSVEHQPKSLTPEEAASFILAESGIARPTGGDLIYAGVVSDVTSLTLPSGGVLAIVGASLTGLSPSAQRTVEAGRLVAECSRLPWAVLVCVPPEEGAQRRAVAQLGDGVDVVLVPMPAEDVEAEVRAALLAEVWRSSDLRPTWVIGEWWSETALAGLSFCAGDDARPTILRVARLSGEGSVVRVESSRDWGRVVMERALSAADGGWLALTAEAEVAGGGGPPGGGPPPPPPPPPPPHPPGPPPP
ncbi:MAG: acyl-CoA dehydrogenase family protein, partial [Gemmataceae bacterium]|nr:acyl-CoA dehydrogenase family protein [Gemmataceae bacterium]